MPESRKQILIEILITNVLVQALVLHYAENSLEEHNEELKASSSSP
jgi:hypothetical protein